MPVRLWVVGTVGKVKKIIAKNGRRWRSCHMRRDE